MLYIVYSTTSTTVWWSAVTQQWRFVYVTTSQQRQLRWVIPFVLVRFSCGAYGVLLLWFLKRSRWKETSDMSQHMVSGNMHRGERNSPPSQWLPLLWCTIRAQGRGTVVRVSFNCFYSFNNLMPLTRFATSNGYASVTWLAYWGCMSIDCLRWTRDHTLF